MKEKRRNIMTEYVRLFYVLQQAQSFILSLYRAYGLSLDEIPDNPLETLERELVECLGYALDMLPDTDAVLEECEAEMVEILNDVFVPEEQLYRYVEHTFNGKRIPLTSVN